MNAFDKMMVDADFLGDRVCDAVCTLAFLQEEGNEFFRDSSREALKRSEKQFDEAALLDNTPSCLGDVCRELMDKLNPETTCEVKDES